MRAWLCLRQSFRPVYGAFRCYSDSFVLDRFVTWARQVLPGGLYRSGRVPLEVYVAPETSPSAGFSVSGM